MMDAQPLCVVKVQFSGGVWFEYRVAPSEVAELINEAERCEAMQAIVELPVHQLRCFARQLLIGESR